MHGSAKGSMDDFFLFKKFLSFYIPHKELQGMGSKLEIDQHWSRN